MTSPIAVPASFDSSNTTLGKVAAFMKIGNHNSHASAILMDKGCRTQAQFEAVLGLVNADNFLFAEANPFRQDRPGESYKCTFRFGYVTTDGCYRSVNVTPAGKLKNEYCSEPIYTDDIVQRVLAMSQTLKSQSANLTLCHSVD